jgi:hypothetical protein
LLCSKYCPYATLLRRVVLLHNQLIRYFRLPARCRWYHLSSGMLRSLCW